MVDGGEGGASFTPENESQILRAQCDAKEEAARLTQQIHAGLREREMSVEWRRVADSK